MSRGHIRKILTKPLYIDRIAHKGTTYEGQQPAIIGTEQWQRVQAIMTAQSAIPPRAEDLRATYIAFGRQVIRHTWRAVDPGAYAESWASL